MSTFLDDRELGPAIKKLTKGKGLRCAVAFWGNGAVRDLFQDGHPPANARIICDLAMGGSNPEELKALGAPENRGLRHLVGLHAKVYISIEGFIAGSANASNNGIGFLEAPRLVEAGTFHPPNSGAYRAASRWFESIWERAEAIDQSALRCAQTAWARRSAGHQLPSRCPNPASLLDQVIDSPQRFRGVGFAFTSYNASIRQRDEAAAAVIEQDNELPFHLLSDDERNAVQNWQVGNVFAEWPCTDINAWPRLFICIHRGRNGNLYYIFYERKHTVVLEGARGTVLARRHRNLRQELGFKTAASAMAEVDQENVSSVFSHVQESGRQLYESGEELARLLAQLPPWR